MFADLDPGPMCYEPKTSGKDPETELPLVQILVFLDVSALEECRVRIGRYHLIYRCRLHHTACLRKLRSIEEG